MLCLEGIEVNRFAILEVFANGINVDLHHLSGALYGGVSNLDNSLCLRIGKKLVGGDSVNEYRLFDHGCCSLLDGSGLFLDGSGCFLDESGCFLDGSGCLLNGSGCFLDRSG